jgi:hypothetical protein
MKRFFGVLVFAALAGAFGAAQENKPFSMGAVFGASTVDGVTYKMIGLRPEFHIWKLGLGMDITLLMDDNGSIREQDWTDPASYLDKLMFVSWAQRGEPFYFRLGGLSATSLGYGILVDNYSNMAEYPTYKRWGLDIGFESGLFGAQAIIGSFKDLDFDDFSKSGPVVGARAFVKPAIPWIQIGASYAGDLNQYKGLRDTDGDGCPDRLDFYPYDGDYQSQAQYYEAKGISSGTIDELKAAGLLSGDVQTSYNSDYVPRVNFWGADVGFELFGPSGGFALVKSDFLKLSAYAQYAQNFEAGFLGGSGWGAAPGVRLGFGSVGEIGGEFRYQTKGFQFGYFNDTYDLERANFFIDEDERLAVTTKQDKLDDNPDMAGVFISGKFSLLNYVNLGAGYQFMLSTTDDEQNLSLRANLGVGPALLKIIPMISRAEAYFVHNNLDSMSKLFTLDEGTMWGAALGYTPGGGVSIELEYKTAFQDKNGDGSIDFAEEAITQFSLLTKVTF